MVVVQSQVENLERNLTEVVVEVGVGSQPAGPVVLDIPEVGCLPGVEAFQEEMTGIPRMVVVVVAVLPPRGMENPTELETGPD